MGKIITLIMYLLWICTIIVVLATTFTDFQYEDLNIIAVVLLVFSLVNSYFVASHKKQ